MNDIARPAARLAVLLFTLIFSASPARADELQDIDRLLKQGQHAQALERVNRYLAQNPSDAQARFKKGLILAEQNKVAEAIEGFVKLSQDYPKLPEPHNNLALIRDLLIPSETRPSAVTIASPGKTADPALPPVMATTPKKSATQVKPTAARAE